MQRVLVVRLSAMGDVVHGLGALRALAAALPDAEVHLAVQRAFAPLLDNLPYVTVLPHDRRPGLRGMWRTGRDARALGFDAALDFQGNWKSATLCWLSRAALRVGADQSQRREPSSALLLNRTVACEGAPHPARLALAAVRAIAPAAEELPPRLVATPEEIEREAAAVRALGVDPERPFRMLMWTGPGDPRDWPADAMLRETRASEVPALWVAGPDERDVDAPAGVPVLRHGRGELRRLVALGHVGARAGATAMGPDRGAIHVLSACGTASTVLFGPQDPALTAPVGSTPLVRADAPPCAPCRSRRCTHPDGPVCMDFDLAGSRIV